MMCAERVTSAVAPPFPLCMLPFLVRLKVFGAPEATRLAASSTSSPGGTEQPVGLIREQCKEAKQVTMKDTIVY